MKPLCLSPLPTHRTEDPTSMLLMEQESFVDEAVVTALVNANHVGRSVADPDDLALAADDLDFAGWRLSKSVTVRSAEVPPHVIDAIVRRTLPTTTKPRGGSRHSGSKGWWLAGAGMLILTMVSLPLLQSLVGIRLETLPSPERMTISELLPVEKDEPMKGSPELTEFSPSGR